MSRFTRFRGAPVGHATRNVGIAVRPTRLSFGAAFRVEWAGQGSNLRTSGSKVLCSTKLSYRPEPAWLSRRSALGGQAPLQRVKSLIWPTTLYLMAECGS